MHLLRLLKADDVVEDVAETEQMRRLTSPALTLWEYAGANFTKPRLAHFTAEQRRGQAWLFSFPVP